MATPDMDVIKEIPGYKVILKAILKSQIQQLVEQLSSHTDEESVILTASVSDGTLSHLGSDSGKTFLEDHEDLKSQFLGFCLKKHHRKKQQEKERQEMLQKINTTPTRLEGLGVNYPAHRTPRFPSPSQQGVHPVSLMRASGLKSGSVRHEPYPVRPRMQNANAKNINPPASKMPMTNQVIKIEADDPDLAQLTSEQTATATDKSVTSQSQSPSHTAGDTSLSKDVDPNSESSSSTIINETPDLKLSDSSTMEGLNLDTDYSGLLPLQEESEGGPNTPQTPSSAPQTPGSSSGLDTSVNVKVEALTESEMELEITGVELGPSKSSVDQVGAQESWTPDMANLGYGGSGAMGSSTEFQSNQPGYSSRIRNGKRENYTHYSDELRAKIAQYAIDHGVTSAKLKFEEELRKNIGKSTIRYMCDAYRKRTSALRKKAGTSLVSDESMLGEYLDNRVKGYIQSLVDSKAVVNTDIVMGSALGIVKAEKPDLLKENGGHVSITNDWANSLLTRMDLVKRIAINRGTTLPENFREIKAKFLQRISDCVRENSIPDSLIINCDQTDIQYVPCGDWTVSAVSTGPVEVASLHDRRSVTVMMASTASAQLLPPQIIYSGKTERCHPEGVVFPDSWNITHSEDKFSTNTTLIEYADKILIPYVNEIRDNLPPQQSDQVALVIMDMFECHQDEKFLEKLKNANILVVYVPTDCTNALRPQDVAVNKPIKESMKKHFGLWYALQIQREIAKGTPAKEIKISLNIGYIKPLHARWIIEAFRELGERKDVLQSAFMKMGFTVAINSARCKQEQ